MRTFIAVVAFLVTLIMSFSVRAEDCGLTSTCVPREDMQAFLTLLREQKCRNETPPEIKLDQITIIEDKDGRIFVTGAQPHPYTVKMTWCNYEITATGGVKVVVARRIPSTWGFRFRPKFASSFLFVNAFETKKPLSAIDVGVLWEGFFYKSWNLNVATGFRSAGLAVGLDVTKNFAAHAGYAISYDGWRSNPIVGLSFAFW